MHGVTARAQGRDCRHNGVAELHDIAVGERHMLERHFRTGRQVSDRAGAGAYRNGRRIIWLLSARELDRQSGPPPLGKTDIEPSRAQAARTQQPDGVVRVDAVRSAAVRDHLPPLGQRRS